MARNGRTAAAGNSISPAEEPSSQEAFLMQGVDVVRGVLGQSIGATTDMLDGLEQWQALHRRMLAGWHQALALSASELDQAKDPAEVMALPARMVNHQLEQSSTELVKALQDVFDLQSRWAEQWRTRIAEQMQQAAGSALQAGSSPGGMPPASVAAMGQFHEQWLALTRRWLDSMNAAGSAGGPSAGS